MKKIFLSTFLIAAFVVSVAYQHFSGNAANYVSPIKTNNGSRGSSTASNVSYKDGQYTGISADAYYGKVQVMAVIQNGKLTDVQFLSYPQDRNTSVRINNNAMTALKSEAIQAQSAKVDVVSGATDTTAAFQQSLASALQQAI